MTSPTPDEARELLERAGGVGRSVTAGVSWPYVLTLLGMGAISSLAVSAFWLARRLPGTPYLHYPLWLMLAWVGVFLAIGVRGARGAKRGFGRRWLVSIAAWAVAWTIAVFVPGLIGDPLWFAILMSVVLAVVTIAGALWELRR